ncbi:MAG: DNA replication protein DnaC [Firmicutes bacterium HGW-Firmicutes-1]|jgi:DNA replication protein DnaC|nr:MAG: DNA replication protein DnaC [Firmicutes bacterium HGW-Firmicutes-1]
MPLSSSQFKSILREYDYKRTKNAQTLRDRHIEIKEKISKIEVLDAKIATRGIDASKLIIKEPQNRDLHLQTLKTELQVLKEEKQNLLEKYGYNKFYLDPIYDCEICKDTGYVESKKCLCLKQSLVDIAYEQSNLKDILLKENFSTFSFDYYSSDKLQGVGTSPLENMKGVYHRCKKFVESFDQEFSNLILFGQTGLGKTFLCNCIAKELLDSSYTVLYLSAFKLFKLLETYRFKNDDQEISFDDIDDIYTCDLLIIDDLGSEVINSFTSSELFSCLNTRLLTKKPTVISTNLHPSGLSKYYSDRIVSRILGDFAALQLIGDDIRLQKYN